MQPPLESIVSKLYDGVTSPEDWYAGLDALCHALGGSMFHLLRIDGHDLSLVESLASTGAPADKVLAYEEEYMRHDERVPVVWTAPAGRVLLDHEVFDARAMLRNPTYDLLDSMGLRHGMGFALHVQDEFSDLIGLLRERADGPFSPRDKALCEQLMPHLQRAAGLRARMTHLAAQAALGHAALDGVQRGVAVVDVHGRIRYANPALAAHLARHRACRVRHGRLRFASARDQARFERLLAQACGRPGAVASAGAMRVDGAAVRLGVSVLPLRAGHPLHARHPHPLALVVVADPEAGALANAQLLAQALDLTPTEARLAQMLAAGCTVNEFAAVQGCTQHTARTHLKNLLRKSGCHRQVEVVRLVQSLGGL